MKKTVLHTLPLASLAICFGACSLFDGGSNDGIIGDDSGVADEIGELDGPGEGGDGGGIPECYGMPAFDIDAEGLLSDVELAQLAVSDPPDETGEIGCYTPRAWEGTLYKYLSYPNPVYVPTLSDGYDEPIMALTSGMICNFVIELIDTPFSTATGATLPYYTGAFIDSEGVFTSRYTACWEPCMVGSIAYTNPEYPTANQWCMDHVNRHGIDPEGNGYNYGTQLYDEGWNLGQAYLGSSCQAPQNWLTGDENPQWIINARAMYGFIFDLVPYVGEILAESIHIEDAPWTWNWFNYTGGCHYYAKGFMELAINQGSIWYWDTPCATGYMPIITREYLDFINPGGEVSIIREGYCYADALTVSGYEPPPDVDVLLEQLDDSMVPLLDTTDWNKLILAQHAGGLSWPEDGIRTKGFERLTATLQLNRGLVDRIAADPKKYLAGAIGEVALRTDGSGIPKPALRLRNIMEGSLLWALGYRDNDLIFGVEGDASDDGIKWTIEHADLQGQLEVELVKMIELAELNRSVSVMHERDVEFKVADDENVQTKFPGMETWVGPVINERHFFILKTESDFIDEADVDDSSLNISDLAAE